MSLTKVSPLLSINCNTNSIRFYLNTMGIYTDSTAKYSKPKSQARTKRHASTNTRDSNKVKSTNQPTNQSRSSPNVQSNNTYPIQSNTSSKHTTIVENECRMKGTINPKNTYINGSITGKNVRSHPKSR